MDEVTPVEDLMREHGILRRVLLVYQECDRRLATATEPPPGVLDRAADLVRRFVEDYHERLEEEHVFPRFERAGRLMELVAVLRVQHTRGRGLTDRIRSLATKSALADADRAALRHTLQAFAAMYRPHAAREDTVLFPALRPLVGAREYAALGERFEDEEHRLFGAEGFAGIVDRVARLERVLDIHALERFTPP
jgi:hemerythrin-like domain-containing protein